MNIVNKINRILNEEHIDDQIHKATKHLVDIKSHFSNLVKKKKTVTGKQKEELQDEIDDLKDEIKNQSEYVGKLRTKAIKKE